MQGLFEALHDKVQYLPRCKESDLTPNMPLIHTSFTYRKWNMDEICGLKLYSLYVHTSQKIFVKFLHGQAFFQTCRVGCLSLAKLK